MLREIINDIIVSTLFFAGLIVPANIVSGQDYSIKSFTTANGLPHNNIRAIARDSSGFLWVGSWDGLSRFDGYEFRNYFHEPDDSTSLPYFSVSELCVDGKNNLWILTDTRDLSIYNRTTENFTVIRELNGKRLDHVNNISVDREGNLVILCNGVIIKRDPSSRKAKIAKLITEDNKLYFTDENRKFITIAGDSLIYLTWNIVTEFRKVNDSVYLMSSEYPADKCINEPEVFFDRTRWRDLYISLTGNKWLFSENGLFRFDEKLERYTLFKGPLPKSEFTGRKSFYWGDPDEGLYYFIPASGRIINIPERESKWPCAIMGEGKYSFWFGSMASQGVAAGLSMVSIIPGYFSNTLIPSSDSSTPAVYSVIIDRDNVVWTGVRGFDHIVRISPGGSHSITDRLSQEMLRNAGHIRTMIPAPEGIWIGYYVDLLQFYDYESGKYTVHKPSARNFRAMVLDPEGNLYIGSEGKLMKYYPSMRKTDILWEDPEPGSIFSVLYDQEIVWAGMSHSRLLRYNTFTGEASVIKAAGGVSNIEDIITGEEGEIWLALLGKGVCRFNTVNNTFTYYTTSKGLSNNTTYCLLKDRPGHIWVSTNHGISRIDPVNGSIRTFDEADGIAISEFNSGASFISAAGEFLFGGMGGYIRFHPDSINTAVEAEKSTDLLLSSLEVSGVERHLHKALNESDTIILERGENNLHITFSSNDFVNSDKILYRYRLYGINDNWIVTGHNNRNINYSNLKPGWYTLALEATDIDGYWTDPRNVTIRIKPSFYQTTIFRIIAPLFLLAALALSVVLYIRQVRQKERSKQYELKLQSLRSQMNPHFIFNSLNSINYFISNKDSLSANRYIADFSRLIRSILANMDTNFIPLENELNSVMDYLRIEHLRFGDKFDYRVDSNDIKNIHEIEVYPGIVQPFIENAIWHGVRALENRKGMIKIVFSPVSDEITRCTIEDDGIGRKASIANKEINSGHRPKGIGIITERLHLTGKVRNINYTLKIDDLFSDREETGTRIVVDIPSITIKTKKHDKGNCC